MSKEETMVERCARRIARRLGYYDHDEVGGKPAWRHYEFHVRAVIDALEEGPTTAMTLAGFNAARQMTPEDDKVDLADAIYRAMLSKAKEGTGE